MKVSAKRFDVSKMLLLKVSKALIERKRTLHVFSCLALRIRLGKWQQWLICIYLLLRKTINSKVEKHTFPLTIFCQKINQGTLYPRLTLSRTYYLIYRRLAGVFAIPTLFQNNFWAVPHIYMKLGRTLRTSIWPLFRWENIWTRRIFFRYGHFYDDTTRDF